MKQGGLIIAGLVLMFSLTLAPVAAQNKSVNFETYILDDFDNRESAEWTWTAVGSKFITDGYPVLKYFDGMPNAIRVMQNQSDGEYKILGVQFKFNRKGDNWVDIIPVKANDDGEDAPYEIPFKGVVSRLDMWVWGAGYNYELQALVRDCFGRVHTLSFGWLNHEGWKNMSVNVPTSLAQKSRYFSDTQNMTLVALRIRTKPTERVDDFYIFFDQFKALTDTFMPSYDGFELVGTDFNDSNEQGAQ
ncbi:flagellar filament outer layer protein FlaA [Brucepastera parasyntrophica]|uniref:flagellar filament outer layer protein FlaA n=1 Tax=Brucepastera parasyntrophica TaxID=2880008 RepID=UPI00210CA24B|nr:flagellar filament outer layer protein FlaA [Brucepastera parasyntrophica]ULQ60179.1 flagellar filament outer layer protein FlaA [Brucepastera parasyntrophica]